MIDAASRVQELLAELEAFHERACEHEEVMLAGLDESVSWSEAGDRAWIRGAAAAATQTRLSASSKLRVARELASRIERRGPAASGDVQ